jgi:tetratricopeptide (TPR) repeat protein
MTRKRALWLIALLLVAAAFGLWVYVKVVPTHPAWLDIIFLVLGGLGAVITVIAAIFQAMQKTPGQVWEEAGQRSAAPCQAPRPLADFVGREKETKRLVKALQPGGKAAITGIVGMGGIGKTELAKVVAHQVARRFHDGVLWADCGQEDLSGIADRWATVCGVEKLPGDDFPVKAAAWRGLISQKEALLILDDVRPGQPVDELFPPSGRSAMLLTSRQSDHPALAGAERLQLDQFTQAEALALAEKVLGQAAARRQQAEATHLFELLGYLPLAVSIALSTAQRNGWRLAVLNQRLEAAGAFKALDEPGLRKGLTATFQTAWATLPADQQRAFALLAVFNQGPSFDTAAFAAVLDFPPLAGEGPGERSESTATALLHRLAAASLLTPVGDDRWALHPLLRVFAAGKLPADDPAWGRMAAHYVQVARAADDLYLTKGRTRDGLALFDREWPHIRAGQGWATTHVGTDDAADRLCSDYPGVCPHCLDLRLEPRKRIPWLEAAAAAARRLEDKKAEGVHLGNLGIAYKNLGEVRRAIGFYEQALAIDREISDRRGEGADLGNLGLAYAALGEVRRAIGFYEQRLAIAREISDRRGEGNALGNLGLAYAALGKVRRAIGFYEQQLAIAREIGDRRGEGTALGNLGRAHADLGGAQQAIYLCEQSLAIKRETGDRPGEGEALNYLGYAYFVGREFVQAMELHRQAIAILEETGYKQPLGVALNDLAETYLVVGNTNQTSESAQKALAIAQEIGDRRGEGNALANMGLAQEKLGDLTKARRLWQEALAIFQAIEAPEAKKVQEWLAEGG